MIFSILNSIVFLFPSSSVHFSSPFSISVSFSSFSPCFSSVSLLSSFFIFSLLFSVSSSFSFCFFKLDRVRNVPLWSPYFLCFSTFFLLFLSFFRYPLTLTCATLNDLWVVSCMSYYLYDVFLGDMTT